VRVACAEDRNKVFGPSSFGREQSYNAPRSEQEPHDAIRDLDAGTYHHTLTGQPRHANDTNYRNDPAQLAIGRCKEWRQGVGGGVRRMPHIGQAKGGFNRLQQRIVGLEAGILHATHSVVRDGDEHHLIIEVGRILAIGGRQE
jgi:hypothetical protein